MSRRKPIPKHAKQVFQGKIFDVWQWEQTMFDGSTAVFERLKRPNTVQVVAVVGDKILVQSEEQPDSEGAFTAIPGGRCDGDEEPLAAAKRELLEETGYASDDWALWREMNPITKMEWTIYTFIARNCTQKTLQKLDAGEKVFTRLISFEEFLDLADDPSFYSPDLAADMLRVRLDAGKRKEFRELLYGN